MTKVQIYYDDMEGLIQKLGQMSSQVVERQSQLRNHAQVLVDGGWVGSAAKSFYDEFFNLVLPALSKLEHALDTTSDGFKRASDILRDAENEGRNLFGRGGGNATIGGDGGASLRGGGGGNATIGGDGGASLRGGGSTGGGASGNIPLSQREQVVQRFLEAVSSREASLTDVLGIINNGFGGVSGLLDAAKLLPEKYQLPAEILGVLLQTAETGSEATSTADILEKLSEGAAQGLTELALGRLIPPVGVALAVSDLVQVGGTVASGFSNFVHDVNPDPQLAGSIKNFNTTLENADLGSITGSFASMVVDLGQMGVNGMSIDPNSPFTSALSATGLPGAIIAGAIRNPDLLQELGHNSLTFVGSVVDFGVGVTMLPGAAIDMGADTARVGTHAVGQFFDLPPSVNETISNAVGDGMQIVGNGVLSVINPIGFVVNQLPDFDAPDVSGWLGSLIPSP